MSLMATTSRSSRLCVSRTTLRPILPKPINPMRVTVIESPFWNLKTSGRPPIRFNRRAIGSNREGRCCSRWLWPRSVSWPRSTARSSPATRRSVNTRGIGASTTRRRWAPQYGLRRRGVVTFAGSVAGMISVTIEPVPGFKVSVSYLSSRLVRSGQQVNRGTIVGRSGSPHGVAGVHLSTRIGGSYVDPRSRLGCQVHGHHPRPPVGDPSGALSSTPCAPASSAGPSTRFTSLISTPGRPPSIRQISTGCCSCPPEIRGKRVIGFSPVPPTAWR